MERIDKRFGATHALRSVDFSVRPGEVHALMGENGAGKSTLIRILTGVFPADCGDMFLNERRFAPTSPAAALAAGISTIHQEVNLIGTLSVAENLLAGRMTRRWFGLDWRTAHREAQSRLAALGVDVDVRRRLDLCSTAVQQLVAVARAVSAQSMLLVMDEPTSSLDQREAHRLLDIIRRLRAEGRGIIFISHSLEEVLAVADRVTVLRNGERVGVFDAAHLSRRQLVACMLGRERTSAEGAGVRHCRRMAAADRSGPSPAAPLLTVRSLHRRPALMDANFEIHRGEVFGISGLLGSGRTELVRLVFGADRADGGRIAFNGRTIRSHHPRHSVKVGMAFVPEDRAAEGIIADLSIRENICLVLQRRLSRWGWLSRRRQRTVAVRLMQRLGIAATDSEQPVSQLSGGNQQKVVLARWIAAQPRLLILDEPTRGIDIGAKAAVESLMSELSTEGAAVMVTSSELDEVLRNCDRIAVLHDRCHVATVENDGLTAQRLMALISGEPAEALPTSAEVASADTSRFPTRAPEEAEEAPSPHPESATAVADDIRSNILIPRKPPPGDDLPARNDSSFLPSRWGRMLRHAPGWLWPAAALCLFLMINALLIPRFAHIEWSGERWTGAIIQILDQAAPVMILAIGMTWVIGLGGIDLSVGAIMAMGGAGAAVALTQYGASAWGMIAVGLGVAALAGVWNGWLISTLRLPPIIATLILLVAGRGLAQLPTDGLVVTFEQPAFEMLGGGVLLGFPVSVWSALAVWLVACALTRLTAWGMYLEAIGGSKPAAMLCGLRVRGIEFLAYVACGTCAGFSGLIVTSDQKAADVSTCGLYIELDVILAVVMGGTPLTGGRMQLTGSLIGALIMQTLTTTIHMCDVAPGPALIIKGVIAVVVCLLQMARRERFRRVRA